MILSFLILFLALISSASSIALQCHFHDSSWGYKCTDNVTQITSRHDRTVTDAGGEHSEERNNENVLAFAAFKTKLFFFPRDITSLFGNLKYISIKSSGRSLKIKNKLN
jgi:hypothetical protein